jgi:excisionase family DNA binding protein
VNEYLSPREFAAMLHVSRRHIDNMIRRGDLEAVHVGGCVRIPYAAAIANFRPA